MLDTPPVTIIRRHRPRAIRPPPLATPENTYTASMSALSYTATRGFPLQAAYATDMSGQAQQVSSITWNTGLPGFLRQTDNTQRRPQC
ncbi:hypothetical protein GCM10010970_12990 [Silvimonas iriomotensis]|uniref:Uncharacterized protein n=1 Tax=Silvimonas iriomotensis TaxID=449662 RepID=A0ABQ2P7X9_9NEIS|nr:hypothetical protein GCM10010970_12990 [Silvimonas iriomotensis]